MTGHDYEYVVADYLRSRGYHNVKVTKGSGDFGVDVIATKNGVKYAVQCKLYSSPVGVSAVQEVVAGKAYYGCKGAMVVTNSTFTAAAEKLADLNDVILLDGVTQFRASHKISGKKILLYLLWLGAVGGIITEILEPIDPSGTLTSVLLIPLLTLPFWIKPIIRLVKKRFAQQNNYADDPIEFDTVSTPIAVSTTPPIMPVTPISKHSFEELEEAAKVLAEKICSTNEYSIEDPDLLASVIALVVHEQLCSTSLIQRRLKLGYTTAARLVDNLESLGIVGPFTGNNSRSVFMSAEDLLCKVNRPFS